MPADRHVDRQTDIREIISCLSNFLNFILISSVQTMNVLTFSNLSRFAQRVSLIKNRATVNEDLDPSLVIKRLKTEILTLREEIGFLKVLNIILSFYFFLVVLC